MRVAANNRNLELKCFEVVSQRCCRRNSIHERATAGGSPRNRRDRKSEEATRHLITGARGRQLAESACGLLLERGGSASVRESAHREGTNVKRTQRAAPRSSMDDFLDFDAVARPLEG